MTKLWKATVEIEVVIASENPPGDYVIMDAAKAEIQDGNDSVVIVGYGEEIKHPDFIPHEWQHSIPRGEPEGKTCEQIVEAVEAARLEAIRNAPMPNQIPLPLGEP